MVWLFFVLLLKFIFSSCVGKKVFSMMIMIKQLFLCCKYYPKAFFFSKLHRRTFSLFVILPGLTLFNCLLQLLIDGRYGFINFSEITNITD